MTIKDAISPRPSAITPTRVVTSSMSLIEALPLLLDTSDRMLGVEDHGQMLGVVTEGSLLDALGRLIVPRDDSSVLTIECPADQYAASVIAHAVEDTGAHLVDVLSGPAVNAGTSGVQYDHDFVRVTLRVRSLNPGPVIQNLERYGYSVVEAGDNASPEVDVFAERLAALNSLLNV